MKTDLNEQRTVTMEEGIKFASEYETLFYETSAIKDDYSSVNKAIELLIGKLMSSMKESEFKENSIDLMIVRNLF